MLAGAVASAAIAMSFTPTYSAFVASIKNSANTLGTGTLTMQETNADGSIVCNSTDGGSVSTNSATCATINKYGGNMAMVPGQTVSTDIKIKNTGTVTATSFTSPPVRARRATTAPPPTSAARSTWSSSRARPRSTPARPPP